MEEVKLPDVNDDKYQEYITNGFQEAISGKEVKTVLIKDTQDIKYPSYLLDMTEVVSLTEESLKALKGLLHGGDTAVYIRNGNNIALIGYGSGHLLYSVLAGVVKHLYSGLCKVYYNKGNGFEPLKETEVSSVRLNL